MTRTTRRRRMTLHWSHIGLTLGLTFMPQLSFLGLFSAVSVGDPTSGEVVRGDLDLDAVSGEDADTVHPHLSGGVGQDFVAVLQSHLEHGVGERLDDLSFHDDRVFFGLRQGPTSRRDETPLRKRRGRALRHPEATDNFTGARDN